MHQILLTRADTDYPASSPPPLRAIRSCSSALAAATLEKLEAAFKAPVLEASSGLLGALWFLQLPGRRSIWPTLVCTATGSFGVCAIPHAPREKGRKQLRRKWMPGCGGARSAWRSAQHCVTPTRPAPPLPPGRPTL